MDLSILSKWEFLGITLIKSIVVCRMPKEVPIENVWQSVGINSILQLKSIIIFKPPVESIFKSSVKPPSNESPTLLWSTGINLFLLIITISHLIACKNNFSAYIDNQRVLPARLALTRSRWSAHHLTPANHHWGTHHLTSHHWCTHHILVHIHYLNRKQSKKNKAK